MVINIDIGEVEIDVLGVFLLSMIIYSWIM